MSLFVMLLFFTLTSLFCFAEYFYFLPGSLDPLLCGNSSDAGYGVRQGAFFLPFNTKCLSIHLVFLYNSAVL